MIEVNKIWKIKLRNGKEFTGQAVSFTIHTIIFKGKGKRFEIKREDILSYELIQDLTKLPYKNSDRDHKLKNRKSGILRSCFATGEW